MPLTDPNTPSHIQVFQPTHVLAIFGSGGFYERNTEQGKTKSSDQNKKAYHKKKSCNLWENTPVNTLIPVKSQQMAPFYLYLCRGDEFIQSSPEISIK